MDNQTTTHLESELEIESKEKSLDFPESSTRQMSATNTQMKIMIDIYEKMNLPFFMTMELSQSDEGKHDVRVYYRNIHALLVDWFFEEVLRRKAGITY